MIKSHNYLTLDAIRGVAAIFVFIQHAPILFGGLKFEHAYLAVDLFFVMSGFVIASAYSDSLESGKLSILNFIKIRMIRLYPLYFLAIVISVLYILQHNVRHNASSDIFGLTSQMAFGLLIIPSPTPGDYPFPLNIPAWSIFFEVIANMFFAFSYSNLTIKVLLYVLGFSGVILFIFVLKNSSMDFGWNWLNFLGGFPRVIYSFAMGLFLYRIRLKLGLKQIYNNWLTVCILVVICLLFSMPNVNAETYDLLVVLLLIPIVVLSATYVEPKLNAKLGELYALLGLVSYAIYILQFSFQGAFAGVFIKSDKGSLLMGILAISLLFLLSMLINKVYDEPVRRLMRNRFL